MTIYQVKNDENQLCSEYAEINRAVIDAQSRTLWDDNHIYHVEELALEASTH